MSSSTSSSEPAKRFLALLALFVLVAEVAFAALLPVHRGRHEGDARLASLESLSEIPRVALISDSVCYGVLDGVEAPADVLDLTSNQAISTAGNAFLLRRLFEAGERLRGAGEAGRVEEVVYLLSPTSYAANVDWANFVAPYFTDLFLDPADVAELEERVERPELPRAMEANRRTLALHPPSYVRRGAVHDPLVGLLRSLKRRLYADRPPATELPPGARALLDERAALETFEPSEITRAFLPRLAELCAEHGARLHLGRPPIAPSLIAAWRESGYWESYRAWVADFAEEHEGVSAAFDLPWTPPGDTAFYDGVHLDQAPKLEWGEALARMLSGHRRETGRAPD